MFLHICDNGFHALLIWDKNLSVKLFLIPAAIQHKTETFTDCIVTDLHAVCVLPDQLRQIHLCDRFTGCDMVQWIFGTLLHHCAIGKRNGIILVNHGKNSSAVGCDLIRLQHFQCHTKTRISVCFSFSRNAVHMVETKNPRVHPSGITVASADVFSLQKRHCLKAFRGCRFRFVDITAVGTAINCFGRQINKPAILLKCIRRQNIGQIRCIADRLLLS